MNDMRRLINLVESQMPEYTNYLGNCTNDHMAPYLEDMMEVAVKISYRTLLAAVGQRALQATFPDFEWGRGKNLKMKDDYAVSYYRSSIMGEPVMYVRESGIEHVFAKSDFDIQDAARSSTLSTVVRYAIMPDGEVLNAISGGAAITVEPRDENTVEITQSSRMTPAAHASLVALLNKIGAQSIIDDEEEKSLADYLSDISK